MKNECSNETEHAVDGHGDCEFGSHASSIIAIELAAPGTSTVSVA